MPQQALTADAKPATDVGVDGLVTNGLFAAIAAMAANGVLLLLALEALGVPAGFPLSWGPVLASSAIPAVLATAVYGVLARLTNRPNRTFVIVAAIVLVLSFAPLASPPPDLSGAPTSVFVTLGTMHVAAAVTIVATLVGRSRRSDSSVSGQ